MYGEINVRVEDGNLGRGNSTGNGVQVKIGASSAESTGPILIKASAKTEDIKKILGNTPLADACMDGIENGLKTIYAIPVPADVHGAVSSITQTGTGVGNIMIEGDPYNAFHVIVEITESGNVNEGTFSYSTDGGNNYSEEITIPMNGLFEVDNTGISIRFVDGQSSEEAGKSFLAGDTYSFTTTAPTMSNSSVLQAIETLQDFPVKCELVHIVGVSNKSLWAALQSVAQDFLEKYKRPCIFLCEGRSCGPEEQLVDYIESMRQEKKGINSMFLMVCLSYGLYQRKDGRIQNINLAGVISGLLGRAKESLSVGYVKQFPISAARLQKLQPDGIETYSRTLDDMGYTVFRQYTGLEDYYVANANTFAAAGSDFPYVEHVRVLNRIIREVNIQATYNLQCEIDPEQIEASVKAIEAELNIPLEECVADQIISSGNVTINTENLNILASETMDVDVTWVPMGSTRRFNLTFGVKNPYINAE